MPKKKHDLYTFVAECALSKDEAFVLKCNCGGTINIIPPFQEEYVVCPVCESSIGIHVIEGDPGYLLGQNPETNEPFLIHVQGSSITPPNELSEEERKRILDNAINHTKNL
jgi:hypothetical protein